MTVLNNNAADRLAEPVDAEAVPRLPFPVVGIGASAGGLEAFIELFQQLPPALGIAFVLIQHLPPERESLISEILARHTSLPVLQIEDGMRVEADHVYVIRPGRTLTIKEGRLHLSEPLEKPGHRHPVDDFFRSLAEEQRERAVSIIMSGMGSNGSAGAQVIKAVGGICIAQDPATAKFPSMPQHLIDAGLADYILKPDQIPDVVVRYVNHPYARTREPVDGILRREQQAFNEILAVLRTHLRQEFGGYKKPTVLRRIQRRMGLHQVVELSEYARLLRQTPSEATALADDLVIHVTGFFRDPDAWESLRKHVIAPLIAESEPDASLRAWVTACSTGEEAYTLAMLLCEEAETAHKPINFKIFATDLADRSLGHARQGVYPAGIEADVTPARLERFFDKEDSTYQIKREVRELIVFAPQNVLQDPPFSRLDICTCRNLLIYLEPEMQKRVLSLLHFGLREGGVLFLGNSETITLDDFYEPIDKKWRIYRRTGSNHNRTEFPLIVSTAAEAQRLGNRSIARASVAHLTQRKLLEHFTPPAVAIDRQQRVLYFHGDTSPYLMQPAGEPTRDLLAMSRDAIRGALRIALHKAMTEYELPTVREIVIDTPSGRRCVTITIASLEQKGQPEYFLVSFKQQMESVPTQEIIGTGTTPDDNKPLLQELQTLRDELQKTIEELQTSNEELKASNEEVTSVNEELQSTNEEMETSREELQSLNEELSTVNSQLQTKMEELESSTNDLSSLLSSTDIAVLFLDTKFRIRRFTPAVRELIDLLPSDVDRPLNDLARKFTDPDLLSDAQTVLNKLVPIEKEITSNSGRWYVRRILPYRTIDNHIEGVVITFVDFTRQRVAEIAQRESEELYRLMIQGMREYAIFLLDPEGRVTSWNFGAERLMGYNEAEALGQPFEFIFTPEDCQAGAPECKLKIARETGESVDEGWHVRKNGERFWGSGIVTALYDSEDQLRGFAKMMRDNTERRLGEQRLDKARRTAEAANEAKDQFLSTVSHELRTPLSVILMWISMMKRNPVLDSQVQEAFEGIERSAFAQKRLIEDLLDTSRISSGKLQLNRRVFQFVDIARAAAVEIRPIAEAKQIDIREELADDVGLAQGDPDRIRQVLLNLLSNAVKFTPPKGQVNVVVARQDSSIMVRVIDTGKGISAEFLPYVFERFKQAENVQNRSHGGLGLGLSIAKQLVELHGGSITVHSPGLNQGATFTVQLPLPSIPASEMKLLAPTMQISSPNALEGISILLVEDDRDTLKALRKLLIDFGAIVTAVESGSAALQSLKLQIPDIIVSDIGMADMNGLEFIRQIRQAEASTNGTRIPAIALSAFAREEDCREALEAGFHYYLTKPVDEEKLISTLAKMLSEV